MRHGIALTLGSFPLRCNLQILVRGAFTPSNVAALARRLGIPTTLMFMSCPGPEFPFNIADFCTRIISM